MDRFFRPRSIVIFGASTNPQKGGWQVLQNFKQYVQANGGAELFIVHPKVDEIDGVKCYRSLDELPPRSSRIDLAVLVVPVPSVMPIVRECIAHNIRGILIESGNLSNDDGEVKQFTQEIHTLLQGKDIRITGPNSIGFNVPDLRYCTPIKFYAQFLQTRQRNVSIVGQSGLFVTGFVERFFEGVAHGQPFGVSNLAAIGNKLDVNESDLLEYYLADPKTHVVGMYLEDIKDGPRFLRLIKQNAAADNSHYKPIVLLKAGRSPEGAKAIQSHTGSLAGNYEMIKTIAHQYGLFLVDSYEELFELLAILCRYPGFATSIFKRKSLNIGVISISGSGCVLSADFAYKYQLKIPELDDAMKTQLRAVFPDWAPIHNPIDTWASIELVGPKSSFNKILQIFLDSRKFDAIVMMSISSQFAAIDMTFINQKQKEYPNLPILLHYFGGQELQNHIRAAYQHDIPVVQNLEDVFKFLRLMCNVFRLRK
jgi:acetyltransferase